MMPPWHHWRNRPLTVGTLRGSGGGRSLVVNGHIDVVAAGDESNWTSPPFAAEVRDGRIYGRGACDMKGGVGAALFALRRLHACGVGLAGDVFFEAVPDEETCAMGTIAAIARGYRADAGLVPEPTRFNLWVATRGLLHGTLSVQGRSAHAEMNQPPWEEGGGVNAIQKATYLLGALDRLSEDWARRDSTSAIRSSARRRSTRPRSAAARFISNVPERCDVALNTTYLPGNADERRLRLRSRGARSSRRFAKPPRRTAGSPTIHRAGAGTRTIRPPRSTPRPRSSARRPGGRSRARRRR